MITLEDVKRTADEIVADYPKDFRYKASDGSTGAGCYYSPEAALASGHSSSRAGQFAPCSWTPCLAGEIVRRLAPETYGRLKHSGSTIKAALEGANDHSFSYEAQSFMFAAQREQDRGKTWAEAVEYASR